MKKTKLILVWLVFILLTSGCSTATQYEIVSPSQNNLIKEEQDIVQTITEIDLSNEIATDTQSSIPDIDISNVTYEINKNVVDTLNTLIGKREF